MRRPESDLELREFLDHATADMLGRRARGERVLSYESRLRTKAGSIKQVLIDGSGLFRDGQFVHGRLVPRDITGLMEREQAARHRAEAAGHLKLALDPLVALALAGAAQGRRKGDDGHV